MDAFPLRPLVQAAAVLLLGGCAALPPSLRPADGSAERAPGDMASYRCDGDLRIQVRFDADGAQLDGLPGGPDRLLLDAGGLTPQQRVYSGPRVRAEFGLEADGTGAVLQLLQPQPATLRCSRT